MTDRLITDTQSFRGLARKLSGSTALAGFTRLTLWSLVGALGFSTAAQAQSLPTGGSVAAGSATIATRANSVTVNQASQSAVLNWDSFNIGAGKSVRFDQPGSTSVALNRVTGSDASVILGSLTANGKVFLVNANGVLFGKSAQVSVGGLVASTLNIADADFMAGHYAFAGASGAAVLNQGTIVAADQGYVALLGANVANTGVIKARLGTVALAAGQGVTLDVAGDGLLNVTVDAGALNALVSNGGLIRADGGTVLLTAQAAGQLLHTVVNNTGVIEARTIYQRSGTIKLLGDMTSGATNVTGTLDASAPAGGDGGFIETSAAQVNIAAAAKITTVAPRGTTGTWLIDPEDFTIASNGNISGATLSALLVTNSVTISTLPGPSATVPGTPPVTSIGTDVTGNGDINVNEAVAWTASPSTTTLRMNAVRDININAAITATNGNVVACCGRDVNVNAAITTTNGSVLLNAGRYVNVNGFMTTTDGNIALCAGLDVRVASKITLTRGSTIPSQSLGLTPGLLMIAGAAGTGPGIAGGTVIFSPLAPPATVTAAPVTINYNPISYAAPSDYSVNFVLTEGAALMQHMLLFPNGGKVADGSTATTLTGFNTTATSGLPVGVTLVAGPNAVATYDSADAGTAIGITYSGYTLAGANADQYALAGSCCVTGFRTTGTITPAPVVVIPPVETPPVETPPVETPPVDVPPVVVPPVDVPPVVVPPVDVPPVVVPPIETPPVDVPPVVVPPVETPPVEVPPVVVAPPVDVPVVIPPVVTPPVVTPPVTTPVVVPPVETPPVVTTPVVTPPVVTPPVVLAPATPAGPTLVGEAPRAFVLPGLVNFAVAGTGVRMPTTQLASTRPVPVPVRQQAALPQTAPVVPVLPRVYPAKQDRN